MHAHRLVVDDAGRLPRRAAGGTVDYDYGPSGLLDQISFPNGVTQHATWDPAGQLTNLDAVGPTGPITDNARSYDSVGNLIDDTTLDGPVDFDYDEQQRLTGACYGGDCVDTPTHSYTYDVSGNRLAADTPQGPETFTYDASDRIIASTGPNPAEFTYDPNGNLTYDGEFTYHYNQANQLVTVERAGTATPGAIAGTVDDGSTPVAGVTVKAFYETTEIAATSTASDGTYTLDGLAPGTYRLRFEDPQGRFAPQWFNDAATLDTATDIAVAGDDTHTANATLTTNAGGVALSGTVTDAATAQPVAGADVLVVGAPDPEANPTLPVGDQPGTGSNRLRGLRVESATNGVEHAPGGPPVLDGQPVLFSYDVTNTGLATLHDVAVTNSGGQTVGCPTDDGDHVIDELAAGATVTCSTTIAAGSSDYSETITGTDAAGVSDTDPAEYRGIGACTIIGTESDDTLTGTSGDDIICGLGGNDVLKAKQGNDILLGGPGDDTLHGDYDDDVLDGGDGNDKLLGNQDNDTLIGGAGDDRLEGGQGTDFLEAGDGHDEALGNQKPDIIWGGPGNDDLRGGFGTDELYGEDGDDLLDGNQEVDTIVGGPGNDSLDGGYGADLMYGGLGTDSLDGRQQADLLDGGPGVDVLDGGNGANYLFEGEAVEAHLVTDPTGAWAVELPPGRYVVMYSADGYAPRGHNAASDIATLTEVVVDVDQPATLTASLDADTAYPAPPPAVPPTSPGAGSEPEVVATYTYDGNGTRLTKTIDGETTEFTWDLNGQLPELATETTAGSDRSFLHGLGPAAMVDDSEAFYYHLDPLGSVAVLTDTAGDAQWSYRYDPFGQTLTETRHDLAAPDNSMRFAGEQLDTETGLYYLRARYYDPSRGQFTQTDPLFPYFGQRHETPYAYASSNPQSFIDPTGLLNEDPTLLWDQDKLRQLQDCWIIPDSAVFEVSSGGCLDFEECAGNGFWAGVQSWSCNHSQDIANFAAGFGNIAPGFDQLLEALGLDDRVDMSSGWYQFGFMSAVAIDVGGALKAIFTPARVGRILDGLADDPFRYADEAVACLKSFSADTPILLANGQTKPISEVRLGDQVWATNPETGESGPRRVTATWPHKDQLLDLELEDGSEITTTEDHHYWNDTDQAWQESQQLDEGDLLLTADGGTIAVNGLDWNSVEWAPAYDLTIDQTHTYYVATSDGDAAVLVHNQGGSGINDASEGLQALFEGGSIRGSSIIEIRAMLTANGFSQQLADNGSGYLFTNSLGEEVRIMSRDGGWDIRVRNQYGNYLDEFGRVADPKLTHRINVGCV